MKLGTKPAPAWLEWVYALILSLFCTHEIDAATKGEWRMLPGLSLLNDDAGLFWFVLLHIPLFALIFWLSYHRQTVLRERARLVACALVIIHAVAHFALSGHALYHFHGPMEALTVYGPALAGLVYIGVSLRGDGSAQT